MQTEETSIWTKELMGAVARGWCHECNESKEMDVDLAMAIVYEVEKQFKKFYQP